jgi:2-polyprenyl-3-methyl-5-hydroxy-6-metoxy-1,4-benzoquinol methylase
MNGESYYKQQSCGRGIDSYNDVERLAFFERAAFDRILLPHFPRDSQCSIYEAAVGPGILQSWLQTHGYKNVEGSDFAENEIYLARMFNPKVVIEDSVSDLKTRFSESCFDVIVALDFYEHLPREVFREFLAVALSRLRRDGVLIMRGPNADSPLVGCNLYNDITHVWAYTTVCLRSLLRIAGYSSVTFSDDTRAILHSGRWWKLPLMVCCQKLLSLVFWSASRVKVNFWGSSLYVYARKGIVK